MTEHIVREWLSDYAALSPEEVHSFATSLEHNQELVSALYSVLENREYYQKLIDPVCNQLFAFYRSREVELQRFTLQFLPTLIYVYLNSVASGKKKPLDLDPASLTQKELRRLEECNSRLIAWGPLPQVESLNAQNRLKVMTALWFIFNRHLSHLHKSALERLCRICSKFNEFSSMAIQALEDIQFRGCFECYAEVILVSGAVRNSIKDTPTGQTLEGPMGISMAVSPATNTVTVSKSMITNASFRTKKLPDDIPIQAPTDSQTAEKDSKDAKNLTSITEEQEDTPRSGTKRVTSGMSLQKLALGKRNPASRNRKVTPPSQNPKAAATNAKPTITNGDSYEMESLSRKNGLDESTASVDSGEKDSDTPPDSVGIQNTPISLLATESEDLSAENSNKNSNDVDSDSVTTPLVSRKNEVEVENGTRGVMQVSTV